MELARLMYKYGIVLAIVLTVAALFWVTLYIGILRGERTPAAIPSQQVQIEADKLVPVAPVNQGLSANEVALFVPTNMSPSNDEVAVRNQVMDHNVQSLVQGKYIRNTPLGRSAQKIQQLVQPTVNLGGSQDGVQHSVNMEIEAFQKKAKLHYCGFVNTDFTYWSQDNTMTVSLSEKIGKETTLGVEREGRTDTSLLKLNWNW